MAARRRRVSNGGDSARSFAVIVEEMRGHFNAFGEKLDLVGDKVDGLSHRVDGLSDKVDGLTLRVDVLTDRVDGLTDRVDGLTQRVDAVEGRLGRVESAVTEHTRQLKAIEVALDRKVDRDEIGR